jgi:hypothetical protein
MEAVAEKEKLHTYIATYRCRWRPRGRADGYHPIVRSRRSPRRVGRIPDTLLFGIRGSVPGPCNPWKSSWGSKIMELTVLCSG